MKKLIQIIIILVFAYFSLGVATRILEVPIVVGYRIACETLDPFHNHKICDDVEWLEYQVRYQSK
jgi:predicted Kef-type K+ transport protein